MKNCLSAPKNCISAMKNCLSAILWWNLWLTMTHTELELRNRLDAVTSSGISHLLEQTCPFNTINWCSLNESETGCGRGCSHLYCLLTYTSAGTSELRLIFMTNVPSTTIDRCYWHRQNVERNLKFEQNRFFDESTKTWNQTRNFSLTKISL